MKKYHFYSRRDNSKESINSTISTSRLKAATHFASVKQLALKPFLKIFAVSK